MVTEQKKIANCLLEKEEGCCTQEECKKCGWNSRNASRNRRYLKQHGLTKRADGKLQLIVPKNFKGE